MDGIRRDSQIAGAAGRYLQGVATPFRLLDIGASGGIDVGFKAFRPGFEGIGVDPNLDDIGLREPETGVRFLASRIDALPARKPTFWQRTSAQSIAERRSGEKLSPQEAQRNNLWPQATLSTDATTVAAILTDANWDYLDFLKIDVDGQDFEILKDCESLLASHAVLGVGIEVNYAGDGDPLANTFSNIDLVMRRNGFDLFDLSVRRYSLAALPAPFEWSIAGETVTGRPVQGDAVYLRDLTSTDLLNNPTLATARNVGALIGLFDLFQLPDLAIEHLDRFQDLLPAQFSHEVRTLAVQGTPFSTVEELLLAFESEHPYFWPWPDAYIVDQAPVERIEPQRRHQAEMHRMLAASLADADRLRSQLAAATELSLARAKDLAALESSWSWRLAQPARWAKQRFTN